MDLYKIFLNCQKPGNLVKAFATIFNIVHLTRFCWNCICNLKQLLARFFFLVVPAFNFEQAFVVPLFRAVKIFGDL